MRFPFRKSPSMSCQQFVELVTGYLDRSLTTTMLRSIDAHLVGCDECLEYLAQMRRVQTVTGALAIDTPVPPAIMDALLLAFNEASSGE